MTRKLAPFRNETAQESFQTARLQGASRFCGAPCRARSRTVVTPAE